MERRRHKHGGTGHFPTVSLKVATSCPVFVHVAGRLVGPSCAVRRVASGNKTIEVVVLGATDRDALVKTHSRYFGKSGELAGI